MSAATWELEERAAAAVVAAIKEHVATGRLGLRWAAEPIPTDVEPGARDLPALRVEAVAGSGPARQASAECDAVMRPLTLLVRTWSRTPEDSVELWARLRRALEPSDPEGREALDGRLERAGVWSMRVARAGLPEPEAARRPVVEAVAALDLVLWDEP